MKKLFIIGYILGVLMVSAFAKASEVGVRLPIQSVDYTEGSWLIKVAGEMSNPCLEAPRAELTVSPKNNRVFILTVSARSKADFCAQVVHGKFDMTFDLRSLVVESGLKVERSQSYIVRTEIYPFEVAFQGRDVVAPPPTPVVALMGHLTADDNGHVSLVPSEGAPVAVEVAYVDLEKFVNRNVNLIGLFIPLHGGRDQFAVPSQKTGPSRRLIVTGISTAAL